jgi:hypothetical protein
LGFVTLPTTLENKGDPASQRTILVKFLIIPGKSGYNCILGRTALNSLGALWSTVHLKMRYHGKNNEVITMEAGKKGLQPYLWMTKETLSYYEEQNMEPLQERVEEADFDSRTNDKCQKVEKLQI